MGERGDMAIHALQTLVEVVLPGVDVRLNSIQL
jgi:hypothetical protein